MIENSLNLNTSFVCPQCGHNHFLLTKKEITETTTETLSINVHNYADTSYRLTCTSCNKTFAIVNMEDTYEQSCNCYSN